MAAINSGNYVTHHSGGTFEITDDEASTTYAPINGVEEDSFSHTPGMYEPLLDTENGQPSNERRGDARRSTLRIRFKQTASMMNASSLLGLLLDQTKATDDGLLRTFKMIWKQTDHSGDATGESYTYNNCVVTSVNHRTGHPHNVVEVEMVSRDALPTPATF